MWFQQIADSMLGCLNYGHVLVTENHFKNISKVHKSLDFKIRWSKLHLLNNDSHFGHSQAVYAEEPLQVQYCDICKTISTQHQNV